MRVIPWEETLKWTTVEVGGGLELSVMVVAFCTAWTPVSDSISTEHRYQTLQAAGGGDTRATAGRVWRVTQSAGYNDTTVDRRFGCAQFHTCQASLFKGRDRGATQYLPPA